MNYPYQPYMPNYFQPQMQVTKVRGRPGADAFSMGANSSALLLDESGTLAWLCVTDGAGYKTVTPYDITPHVDAPAPDFGTLEARIAKLEAMLNDTTDSSATRKSKPHDGND